MTETEDAPNRPDPERDDPAGADSRPDPTASADPGAEAERLPEVEGELDRALALVRFLRRRCPWDASRTPRTLIPHLLEESHEVVDAIRSDDARTLEGELGDLLLNLAFQVVLAEEEERFDAASVADRLEEKMKRRHPHLFGRGEKEDWERIKARERERARRERDEDRQGVLEGLAEGLDPLLRAHRIQDRVSGVGFDWSDPLGAWEKVAEELDEVRAELEEGPSGSPELEEELGDLLFAVVNLVRLTGGNSTTVLAEANRKFAARFERLEELAAEQEVTLGSASLEALDELWDELKEEGAGKEHGEEAPEEDAAAEEQKKEQAGED